MKSKGTAKLICKRIIGGFLCSAIVMSGVLVFPRYELKAEAHECAFAWHTRSEGSAYSTLYEVYECVLCNKVKEINYKTPEVFVRERLYAQIKDARSQSVVASEYGVYHTVSDQLFTMLSKKNDITVMITYQYDDNYYQTTFPAGTDYSELLQDNEKYYGMPGLNGRCGITSSMGRGLDGGNLAEDVKSKGAEEVYSHIKLAPEHETVYADYGELHTINDAMITTIAEKKTVTTVITYVYGGQNYRTTFPAGADYTELLNDGEQYYGMPGLNGRCGIVTETAP